LGQTFGSLGEELLDEAVAAALDHVDQVVGDLVAVLRLKRTVKFLARRSATFLSPSCQFIAYMRVSTSLPDRAFCFMPGASQHHKDDMG
jgi:hypothetical protein